MRTLVAARSLITLVAVASVAAAQTTPDRAADAIFAQWAKPGTAGCALGVLKDGKPLYVQGYGRADIEHSAPITASTVFHIASLSKQFTAFAIYLLEQEGRLSLDDDIRKYVPELHDFNTPITIRDLLHHTSGLRDQWNLLAMAGWRLEDVITQEDVVNLIWRQQELNFHPKDEFLYSNTGYTLLGLIVQRVSGKSLREFTDERIFAPLGMRSTHFHEHYGDLVDNRAYSYDRKPDGRYAYVALSYSTVGPSSLFTTIDDLARWDENFYTGAVGGRDLLQKMQIKGHLNNGKEIDYASGLVVNEYRGLRTVNHAGGDAGFRTELLRFPDEHFSVITLCNAGDADAAGLAYRAADIYLAPHLKGVAAEAPNRSRLDAGPGEGRPEAAGCLCRRLSAKSGLHHLLYSGRRSAHDAGDRGVQDSGVSCIRKPFRPESRRRAGDVRRARAGRQIGPRHPTPGWERSICTAHRTRPANDRETAGVRRRLLQQRARCPIHDLGSGQQARCALRARRARDDAHDCRRVRGRVPNGSDGVSVYGDQAMRRLYDQQRSRAELAV